MIDQYAESPRISWSGETLKTKESCALVPKQGTFPSIDRRFIFTKSPLSKTGSCSLKLEGVPSYN